MTQFKIHNSRFNVPFVGSAVALVTPFRAGAVEETVLGQLVEFQLREGTDALVVNGSTAEAAAMSAAEQRRAAEVVVERAGGRVPVIVGIGGPDTAAVAELARGARAAGADGLLLSPPPYNKPPQRGILAHYRAVLDAADLPLIVYNVPGRTACNILPETVEALAEDERVVGIKEASGDLAQVAELAWRLGDRLALYSGDDALTLPILSLGAKGVISVLANVAPGPVSRMVHAFLEGEVEEARRLQLRYLPLVKALFVESNPIPVKEAVGVLGFDVGEPRLPLVPLGEDGRATLLAAMSEAGLRPAEVAGG